MAKKRDPEIYLCPQFSGNMEMTCNAEARKLIRWLKKSRLSGYAQEAAFLNHCQGFRPHYEMTSPAFTGCLTGAPLFTDGKDIWGFMDYQIECFLEKLEQGEVTVWQKG